MFARYLRWKHFSFSGGILFPSFMLLFCSAADYLVKKRPPSLLCLSTLYTSLKQNTMGVIFGNMKYRLRERKKNKKLRALFSDQNWRTSLLHQNLCRVEWSCCLFSLTGIYLLQLPPHLQNMKGYITGKKRERGWSTYMFHRIVRRGVLVFFAYSLKDYESVAADVEPRTC